MSARILLVLLIALTAAGSASAISLSIVQVGGTADASSAQVGDTIVVSLVVTLEEGDVFTGVSAALEWDTEGGDVLDIVSASETGLEWHPDGFVFAMADGRPLDPEKITHEFRARMVKAGLDGLRLHDLRHSFATLMLAAGEHPKMVQIALGHSSIQVTMDIYGHVLPGAGKQSAQRFAEYLAGP